jgi:hypothetical protein
LLLLLCGLRTVLHCRPLPCRLLFSVCTLLPLAGAAYGLLADVLHARCCLLLSALLLLLLLSSVLVLKLLC